MTGLCAHRFPDGTFCKRWASDDSRFCHHHRAKNRLPSEEERHTDVNPLARLEGPADVFNVLRETLNAVRLGRITPGQAYAVAYVASLLLRAEDKLGAWSRGEALRRNMIPALLEEEESILAAHELTPLPTPATERDAIEVALDLPITPPLAPLSSYPGYDQLVNKAPRQSGADLRAEKEKQTGETPAG